MFLHHDGVVQALHVMELYIEVPLMGAVLAQLLLEMVKQESNAVDGVIVVGPRLDVLAGLVGDFQLTVTVSIGQL